MDTTQDFRNVYSPIGALDSKLHHLSKRLSNMSTEVIQQHCTSVKLLKMSMGLLTLENKHVAETVNVHVHAHTHM
jgi:hypothetical protein